MTPSAPSIPKTKLFLSYSRRDRDRVNQIAAALNARADIQVFKDTEDILPTEEWRRRLEDLIGEADTIVFCLSPDSAASEVCAWEVEFAKSLNKRIAPVIIREVDEQVPPALQALNYIFFTERDDFEDALAKLVVALNTDIVWIREHTRLGELARRWENNGRPTFQLLRGRDLDLAEQWMHLRPSNAPEPTEITAAFIGDSRLDVRAVERRARRARALLALLAVLLAVSGLAFLQRDALVEQYQWRVSMGGAPLSDKYEREVAHRPKTEFTDCKSGCPVMVVIPPGEFLMGAPDDRGNDSERPQHKVTIAKPFSVSKYEITFAEYDLCVNAGACSRTIDMGWGRGLQPVINVAWLEADQYATWLSRVVGKPYRLLTEAEWEYVARAGSSSSYSFGDDDAQLHKYAYAWFDGNSRGSTQMVGLKEANKFGLHDVQGNVAEWVQDCYVRSYANAPTDGSAQKGGACSDSLTRGGSWQDSWSGLVLSNRRAGHREARLSEVGFRLARDLRF